MTFNYSLLSYILNCLSFKQFGSFIFNVFCSLFWSESALLFGYKVGFIGIFFNIFNFLKIIFIFIWTQLYTYIPFLQVINYLFVFFNDILNIFMAIGLHILNIFRYFPSIVTSNFLLGAAGVTALTSLPHFFNFVGSVVSMIPHASTVVAGKAIQGIAQPAADTVEKTMSSAVKVLIEIILFIFRINIVIGKFLVSFVLKILDIIKTFLKILYLPLKKVIMFLSFIFSILNIFIFYFFEDSLDNNEYKKIKNIFYKKGQIYENIRII